MKKLLKIRLRPDGEWEHVYSDGSVDQEYAMLVDLKEQIIEKALEFSDYEESKIVLQKFLSK
jgi:hypothetical protein